jgi:endonuclease/exonuclease/phosphatase family metal-dependent hydrolase
MNKKWDEEFNKDLNKNLNNALYQYISNDTKINVLKVLSFNVNYENMQIPTNLKNVKNFIESNDFDIICLQEASKIDTELKLKDYMKYYIISRDYTFYLYNKGKKFGSNMYIAYNTNKINETPIVYIGIHNNRGRPIIALKFKKLIIVSLHLHHSYTKNISNIDMYKAYFENNKIIGKQENTNIKLTDLFLNVNVILCGDCNTHTYNKEKEIIYGNKIFYDELQTINENLKGVNFNTPTHGIDDSLDHIITTLPSSNYMDIKKLNNYVLPMSDHLPVSKIVLL